MSDFPAGVADQSDLILSTYGIDSSPLAEFLLSIGSTPQASAAFGVANQVLYYPILVKSPLLLKQAFWYNGATLNLNVNMGIADINGVLVPGTMIPGAGAGVAQAGASTLQSSTLAAATLVNPGNYFIAFSTSSATATFAKFGPGVANMRACGVQQMNSNFALGAATFATPNNNSVVICGFAAQAVI